MSSIISVASEYTMYEVEDDAFEMLHNGNLAYPPQIAMEVLVINGKARRIAKVSTLSLEQFSVIAEDDEEPEEGDGPWLG